MTHLLPRSRTRGLLVGLATVPLLALTALPAMASAPARVALPSPNLPSLTGTTTPLDPTTQLPLRVYLAERAGLAAAATAVADPGNPAYAQYLTPVRYQQQFGTTAAETTAVGAWLSAQGMTITATTAHYIAVTATVAQADTAFDTQVSEYDSTVTEFGQTFLVREPGVVGGFSVPATLDGDVASVTGIDQLDLPDQSGGKTAALSPRSPAERTAATATAAAKASTTNDFQCSRYWGQYTDQIPAAYGHTTAPAQLCGYTPDQLRRAYGVGSSPDTGKGVTIAIISSDYKPTMLADANEFFTKHGEAGFAPGQFADLILPTVNSSCADVDIQPDPEEPIDVESAHIAAPDANILNVATDCDELTNGGYLQTWLDGMTPVVDQHLADIVSGSFGIQEAAIAPADTAAWDPIFQQGALEGIGFDFSTGDSGDEVGFPTDPNFSDVHNTQFPATDTWATAVGATSLEIGAGGTVLGDQAWGDNTSDFNAAGTGYVQAPPGTSTGGSGGGISTMFAEPGYQRNVVPAAQATDNGTGPAARTIPDVSTDGGNLWWIGYTGAVTDGVFDEIPEGGATSGASPLFAGLEADAIQALGHPLGFVNPALYRLNATPAVRDILPVNPADPPIVRGEQQGFGPVLPNELVTLGEDTTLTVSRGYDESTGLGDLTK
ncbi:MAG TPA: protease pro-enzyme activation domain-containing protein, partial [Pseudonocardiaceae bacterium]|nr:protease pro-enzyme activation domain-containing protein [Pseudonocardiaceae bacterium]